jgi:STE24 endopeptidase
MTSATLRRSAIGTAAGFVAGYAAVRTVQALRDRRRPAAALTAPDPVHYGAARRALAVAGIVRGLAETATIAFAVADPLDRALRPLPRPLRAPAFTLVLLLAGTVRDLGVDYVEDHLIERVYGLSRQSAGDWLIDRAKGLAIGAPISAGLTALVDAAIVRAPRRWPWIAIAGTPVLLALATVVAPTFILPLFNRYEPVTGELEARIRALAARYGVGDAAILRFDMSRQTVKANAFVTGVLGTERIALGDTLIDGFEPDETLFVVAHELGHYVRRDPWLGIGLSTAALGFTILTAEGWLRRATGSGVASPAQGARFAFFATLLQTALGPAANAVSRAMERRADRFAVHATGDAAAGVRAFRRLGERNLAEFAPPRWSELLFASHPSLAARIRALEAAS